MASLLYIDVQVLILRGIAFSLVLRFFVVGHKHDARERSNIFNWFSLPPTGEVKGGLIPFFPYLWIAAGMKYRSNYNDIPFIIHEIMYHKRKFFNRCCVAGFVRIAKARGFLRI